MQLLGLGQCFGRIDARHDYIIAAIEEVIRDLSWIKRRARLVEPVKPIQVTLNFRAVESFFSILVQQYSAPK